MWKICPVCGGYMQGDACPSCLFQWPYLIGGGNAAAKAYLCHLKEEARRTLVSETKLGIVQLTWEDQEGHLCLRERKVLALGSAGDAVNSGPLWLEEPRFARLTAPEAKVLLSVERHGKAWVVPVVLWNLPEPLLQQVGLSIGDKLELYVLLRNGSSTSRSPAVSFRRWGCEASA